MYGKLIASGEKMCDFTGQDVWGDLTKEADNVKVEPIFGNCWCITAGDNYKFVTSNGSVLGEFTKSDDLYVSTSNCVVSKNADGEDLNYCFNDQDFTIPGYYFSTFTVTARGVNDLYDLIDVISGEKLLEGYDKYYEADAEEGYLVYADDGTAVEVYQIRQGA